MKPFLTAGIRGQLPISQPCSLHDMTSFAASIAVIKERVNLQPNMAGIATVERLAAEKRAALHSFVKAASGYEELPQYGLAQFLGACPIHGGDAVGFHTIVHHLRF